MGLTSAVQAQLPPPTVPQGWGVNIHFTDPVEGEMARFTEAGYGVARMDFHWARVEKEKGVYDFSPYDRLTETLHKAGVRPLYILDYGNPLYDGGVAPHTDEGRAAFARFASAAATHFKGRDILWEIWNEPNLSGFWKPLANAGDYAKLALAAAKAVRQADPKATILAPGSSGFPWEFFETIFAAGLLEHIDAVSVHPYRGTAPETAAADYARLRVLIARYAPASKRNLPIVSGEWGYTTADKAVSEERQAEYLTRQWLANMAAGVNLSIFYDWRDDGNDPAEREHRFGTVRRNFEPKPSFLAAKKLIADLQGFTFRHRLRTNRAEDWRLLFQKGDELAVVTWVTDDAAPANERMPQVLKIQKGSAGYAALLRAASIRYSPAAVAASDAAPAGLQVTITNPESRPVKAELSVGGVKRTVTVAAGKEQKVTLPLPPAEMRTPDVRVVPVTAKWAGSEVTELPSISVYRTDALIVTAAPGVSGMIVMVDNPGRTAFTGRVEITGLDKPVSMPLVLKSGEARTELQMPSTGDARHAVEIKDGKGRVVLRLPARRFVPMQGFPVAVGAASTFNNVLSVENSATAPVTAPVVATPAGSPAPAAVSVQFDFGEGWQYGVLSPKERLEIPEGATTLTVWVHSTGVGDPLRARLMDSTGQTFQVHLGALDWKGWRAIDIPVAQAGITPTNTTFWGGANDGKIHFPLHWNGVVLVDSGGKKAHRSETLLAAPHYLMP